MSQLCVDPRPVVSGLRAKKNQGDGETKIYEAPFEVVNHGKPKTRKSHKQSLILPEMGGNSEFSPSKNPQV